MTEPGDEDERGGVEPESKTSLESTVDRLDEKAAKEYGSEARARESPKRGSPDEPPD
ncbi:MAG: hypothetical protein WBH51_02155 [Mycolicibacter algericus]|uniref:Uncharacterized protein n=2 Tax=Mycobacteriaceae TaxID=1762 RepID=F5Z2Y6_MYCSD|nr:MULTISPECIES: hypothetical protein [Mycobacteriaceae]AEF37101.1 hypothetical protein JDM601_3101 [Mycolicibacter sinensis]BBX13884.1 hypothetical protein MNVM_29650 [Mycobacterium novum]